MRCEECLRLVEEYFDGELKPAQSQRVSAHLATCATCAAAHDALDLERDFYLRYEREVELTPALWQNVSAGIARLEDAGPLSRKSSGRTGLSELLSVAFAGIKRRPALVPTLALVVVGVILGAIWFSSHRSRPSDKSIASSGPAPDDSSARGTQAIESSGGNSNEAARETVSQTHSLDPTGNHPLIQKASHSHANGGTRNRHNNFADPPDADHLAGVESDLLVPVGPAVQSSADEAVLAANARLLSPEEKEMARHLEQARMLLSSFRNAAAGDVDAAEIAFERNFSRKLLVANASLQLEADTIGDKGTKQVLDTLEPFLLDIANLRDNASRDEVRSIKERMQKQEIIASLQVY